MAEPLRTADIDAGPLEPDDYRKATESWFKVVPHGVGTGDKVPIFELGSQRMMYVQLSWPEHPNKQKQVFALATVHQLLSLPLKAGQIVEAVDLMLIPDDPAHPPAIERVTSVLAARPGCACLTRYLIVTKDGNIFPIPLDTENSIERTDFELIYFGGNWVATE